MADDAALLLSSLLAVVGKDKVSESLFLPESQEYDESNGSYFSALASALKPSLIVKPATKEQVQGLIGALRPLISQGSCRVAIRGAGHTPFAGSANIQGGVTIDLGSLKGASLSMDKSTIEIGVGESWVTVYSELEKHRPDNRWWPGQQCRCRRVPPWRRVVHDILLCRICLRLCD